MSIAVGFMSELAVPVKPVSTKSLPPGPGPGAGGEGGVGGVGGALGPAAGPGPGPGPGPANALGTAMADMTSIDVRVSPNFLNNGSPSFVVVSCYAPTRRRGQFDFILNEEQSIAIFLFLFFIRNKSFAQTVDPFVTSQVGRVRSCRRRTPVKVEILSYLHANCRFVSKTILLSW